MSPYDVKTGEDVATASAADTITAEDQTHAQMPDAAHSSVKMALATLASRLTGFLRTWSMAFALGSGTIASAYSIANNMPSFICDLIMGGILGAAFLPVYMQAKSAGGKAASNAYASSMLNWTVIILGAASVLCAVFAPQVIFTQTFTVGTADAVYEQSVWFFRIFSFQILFYGASGILSGLLNAERTFGLPALAPVANNLITCASFTAYAVLSSSSPGTALVALAVGTTLGVLAQAAMQLPMALKGGFEWSPTLRFQDGLLKETVKMSAATMIYIVGALAAASARNAFSLAAGPEGPAIVSYAWMWFQLPYGIVAVSVATAIFTEMGEAASNRDAKTFSKAFSTGMRWTIATMAPLSVLLALLAPDVSSLFQFGAFSADDAGYVGQVLRAWCVSLPFYAVVAFYYKAFASLHKMTLYAVPMLALNAVQCALYAVLSSPFGLIGITVADLVYYVLGTVVLTACLRKASRFGADGNTAATVPGFATFAAKVCIASAAGGAAAFATAQAMSLLPLEGAASGLATVIIAGAIGLCVYCAAARLANMEEATVLSNRIAKIRSRGSRR